MYDLVGEDFETVRVAVKIQLQNISIIVIVEIAGKNWDYCGRFWLWSKRIVMDTKYSEELF